MNRDNNYDDGPNHNRNYDRNDRNDRGPRNSNRDNNSNDGQAQLFIAKGKNDGMDAQQINDLISLDLKLDPSTISNVKIL